MQLNFFCPRWGSEHLSWESFMTKVKDAGYNGIEYAIAADTTDATLDKVWNLAEQYKLDLIPQHFDTISANFSEHCDLYAKWLERIKLYPSIKINSQTGRDIFSFDQNSALIKLAGPDVVHETHRGKFSFAAHVTKQYFEAYPDLRFTFDISHWVNVAESYLDDQVDAVNLAIDRAFHIHSRVGFPEGPQIPDPRLSEWEGALDKHLSWWAQIAKKYQENEILTITTEFGPFPYLTHKVSQWDINVYMMELLKEKLTPASVPQ